ELLAVEHVLTCAEPAVFGRAQRTPGNAVAGGVQAGERALQAADLGEGVFFGAEYFIHHDLAGDGGAQANLAVDGGSTEPRHAFLENEATDRADIAGAVDLLGPDHEHVGYRAVGNPHLVARELVPAVHLVGAGGHGTRVGAVVGFRQAEAANGLASGKLGQELLL